MTRLASRYGLLVCLLIGLPLFSMAEVTIDVPSAPKTRIRIQLISQGAGNYWGMDQTKVILETEDHRLSTVTTGVDGTAVFENIGCGRPVKISSPDFIPSDSGEPWPWTISVHVPCGSSEIDLGGYGSMKGSKLFDKTNAEKVKTGIISDDYPTTALSGFGRAGAVAEKKAVQQPVITEEQQFMNQIRRKVIATDTFISGTKSAEIRNACVESLSDKMSSSFPIERMKDIPKYFARINCACVVRSIHAEELTQEGVDQIVEVFERIRWGRRFDFEKLPTAPRLAVAHWVKCSAETPSPWDKNVKPANNNH